MDTKQLIEKLRECETGFWYLATPYNLHPLGLECAYEEACVAAAWFVKLGIGVYSPIAHSHGIAMIGGLDQVDHDIWLPADEPFIRAAHGIVVHEMLSWTLSSGIKHELKRFGELNKPVVYLPWPLPEVVE